MPHPRSYNLSRLDAAENIFFARELEQVRARSYDIMYAEKKARMLIPVDNSVHNGAETVTYSQYDRFGVAKIIANYATDFPRAAVKGRQFTQPIKSLGSSYGYSVQEIRAAQFVGKPLEQRDATAARESIEDKIDSIGAVGDTENGLLGLLTLTNTTSYTVPNGTGGTADWSSKSSTEVLKDLNGMVNKIIITTKEVEKPNTMVMPITQFTDISTRPMFETGGSDVTILKFFLQNQPYVKEVVAWDKCSGAGVDGVDRIVTYRKNPDALMLIVPQEFEQFPPEMVKMQIEVACHARCGGCQVFYPLSICYADLPANAS